MWEGWKAGFLAFHTFHILSFPWPALGMRVQRAKYREPFHGNSVVAPSGHLSEWPIIRSRGFLRIVLSEEAISSDSQGFPNGTSTLPNRPEIWSLTASTKVVAPTFKGIVCFALNVFDVSFATCCAVILPLSRIKDLSSTFPFPSYSRIAKSLSVRTWLDASYGSLTDPARPLSY